MRLKGKVAIITGAGSGFGRAGALLFAKEGAKVLVADINDQGGEETVRLVKEAGGEASYIHTDVGVVAEVEKMVQAAVKTYGKLNIFWSNAGNEGGGPIEITTEEIFDLTMNIHVKGGFFGAKFAIPEIIKSGGGSILYTGSASGLKPSRVSPSYSVAKAGLAMLTRSLAMALAKKNIRVNYIAPGVVATPLWPRFQSRNPESEGPEVEEKHILEATPMGRFGQPEDMAQAALYLVSEEAAFVTGAILAVDGGLSAR
ncbi:SDR family NAD(P)-dependent oxidoreductase [Chloroflexota bacterium]